MKKLLTILLVLISFSGFAQLEAGEYINSDTVKIDGVPLLLNTFKQGNLGGASNIFYSTGASSQPASGSLNQVTGGGLLTDKYLTRWDGSKFVNSGIYELSGKFGIGTTNPSEALDVNGNLIADILKSRIPTGTPPLVVASSTKVDSLNAGLLDGKKASDFQLKSDTTTFDATLSDLADSSAAIRSLANTKAVVSGTNNYIMKKTGANTLGNSNLIDYGSYVNSRVQFNAPVFYAGSTAYSAGNIELGYGRIGNNYTYIDFVGDQTYTDYGLRIIRFNTGADASSVLYHRGKGDFAFITQDAAPITFITKGVTGLTIDTLQNSGFGTSTPAARIHSQSTGTQLRLGYDATKYTDLSTGSTGNLTIDPTGDTTKFVGAVNSTGGFFKNGVEITGGGGSMVYPGAGIPVSTGSAWGTSIADNSTNWTSGYNNQIISMTITGTTTKQIQLNQIDGGRVYGSFTDLSEAAWIADTYGIKYTAGKVGIGIGSDSGNLLTVGDGSTNTNIAIRASSLNQRAIYATSTSNNAIVGQGGLDGVYGVGTRYGINGTSTNGTGVYGTSSSGFGGLFEGLGCKATKYYVSSLNTAPASATATGTTGEIRFTSDYIYVCVATNTWKRTQISTW